MQGDFVERLLARVLAATHESQLGVGAGEWSMAAQWTPSARARARDVATKVAGRAGLARRRFDPALAAERLAAISAQGELYARGYELMADERSRALYVDLLAFRVLGAFHVALPVTGEAFGAAWERVEARRVGTDTVVAPGGVELPLLEIDGLRMWAHPVQALALFDLRQYAYDRDGVRIAPGPGDVVVDGGAGFGDSALCFAQAVGATGRVLSCELDPANLELLRRNLALNPDLAGRVVEVPHPLWRDSTTTVDYVSAGGESAVGRVDGGAAKLAVTRAIDDLDTERVDFVKLDVEGAELPALEGARRTLSRDRPRLAIAAYHHPEDLAAIPAFVDDLGLGYRFHLDHFTPGPVETIVFATVS